MGVSNFEAKKGIVDLTGYYPLNCEYSYKGIFINAYGLSVNKDIASDKILFLDEIINDCESIKSLLKKDGA